MCLIGGAYFSDCLKNMPSGAAVLDVGAGSLRDAWEMAKLGYRITAVDLDLDLLRRYADLYDWANLPTPILTTGPISTLTASSFAFATAFDVIEHLEQPQDQLRASSFHLAPCSVRCPIDAHCQSRPSSGTLSRLANITVSCRQGLLICSFVPLANGGNFLRTMLSCRSSRYGNRSDRQHVALWYSVRPYPRKKGNTN
jgi:hypothetical protein